MNLTFTDIMSEANAEKARHGKETSDKFHELLLEEYVQGKITVLVRRFRVGRPGFAEGQFYAPFLIQFEDGERWIVYSTSSLRERIKIGLWDASNIKAIDPMVARAYLVYPSSVSAKERKNFRKKDEIYRAGREYASLDGLVCEDEFIRLVREKADELYRESVETNGAEMSSGTFYDFRGRAFEREVATSLSSPDNLKAWKGIQVSKGPQFVHYKKMMTAFGLNPRDVIEVKATANHKDIGDLASGGRAKTDVIVLVRLANGSDRMITISCKRVSGEVVSCHQYKADRFADVLDKDNDRLRFALNVFQKYGSWTHVPDEIEQDIRKCLQPHLLKLSRWVLGGHGVDCDDKQLAQYVVAYRAKDNKFAVHSVDQYCEWLLGQNWNFKGGTPFSWTYQGQRGTNIQLKMPVWFE